MFAACLELLQPGCRTPPVQPRCRTPLVQPRCRNPPAVRLQTSLVELSAGAGCLYCYSAVVVWSSEWREERTAVVCSRRLQVSFVDAVVIAGCSRVQYLQGIPAMEVFWDALHYTALELQPPP